jgi:dihydrofolate reductase
MRRIVMFNRVTADGFFASAEGKLDWVVPDEEVDNLGASGIPETDTVLLGRKTYEMFAAFWPHVGDDGSGATNPHDPGRRSPAMGAMAKFLNESPKFVFSKTLKNLEWKNSHLVKEFDPREIEAMKKAAGKKIIVLGSGSIVSQLTEHALIDEYQLVVSPLFLGNGRALFGGLAKSVPLDLAEARTFPSGNVLLRYTRR